MTAILVTLGALLAAVLAFAMRFALRIVEHLVEDEIKAHLPHAAIAALERAISAYPPELQGDVRQEWEAELASLQSQPLRAAWFAHQCVKASKEEAKDFQPEAAVPHVTATSQSTRAEAGPDGSARAPNARERPSRRTSQPIPSLKDATKSGTSPALQPTPRGTEKVRSERRSRIANGIAKALKD